MVFGWITLAVLYLFLLFTLASWGEKNSPRARALSSHPAVYSLALAIYCTAWTFFGMVGQASRDTWIYLPIMLGPILVYALGYKFIYKMTLVSKKQHITTIADFIASRYGKRQTVALVVTLIALLATIPYIALQLKAVGATFQLLTQQTNSDVIVLAATVFIGVFAIYFGTRQADVTEYRRGLMLAIAFESSIKLLALVLVAIVGYSAWKSTESGPFFASFINETALSQFGSFSFIAQTIMAAAAIVCLPRQFHVAIIDNLSLGHIRTARWLFPLYLTIISAVIPVIAIAGKAIFYDSGVEPDSYVLSLAVFSESVLLQIIVFVGGLSAATAMIIVATLTLSTMLTNDVILPRVLALGNRTDSKQDQSKRIRFIRRIVIAFILMLAFFYHQQMTGSRSLHSIGLIAFSLVIQLMPAIVGGLYWKRAHAHGVYAGLMIGLIIWVLWLVLPIVSEQISQLEQNELISQGAMISLAANTFVYVIFSWFAPQRLIDRIQAEAFVSPAISASSTNNTVKTPSIDVTVSDLITLLSTFMGSGRCEQLLTQYQQLNNCQLKHEEKPNESFLSFCERALGGVIGASSAKVLLDSALRGKKMDFTEVVNFFDDTTQAMQFNMTALLTSLENMDQGISVVDKHLNLVAWNKRYANLYPYPDALLAVGTPIEKLIRYNASQGEFGTDNVESEVEKRLSHLRSGMPHRFTRQRKDGRVIEMVGNPLPGGGFVTSFNDITGHVEIQQALEESNIDLEARIKKRTEEVHSINAELRLEIERRSEAEKELIRARKAAEDANASKTKFLALASHDVLQPLNAAKLYVSALEEQELPDSATTIIQKLSHSVTSSENLIGTLLDIARLDQGEMKPELESVDVRALLGTLIDEMAIRAKEKGLNFNAVIRPCWVQADKTYLYRIVQNLLSNAVKYTDSGRVLFIVRPQNHLVDFKVMDTGIGVSDDKKEHIFGDFFRAHESKEHGLGLGLGVVKRLSLQLGSDIRVETQPNKGSCFSFNLPKSQPKTKQTVTSHHKSTTFSGMNVLCVDGQKENLDAMQTLLQKWGVNVALANNWDDALTLCKTIQPQILLMDYQLSFDDEKNGLALIEEIRQRLNVVVPAALITATPDETLVTQCKAQGVNFLAKPLKPAKLRALLQSMTRYIKEANNV
ncbi:hybrid sensor histidine kinase/response regulator [Alteromonas sp. V450]|uniref:PAS domain-containing hybrid sensor histidine kinase/response regulator n=1 Tax=Alteromonas sp. V450 TaxID=1912139 RepID=UPI0008FF1AFD|nr:PAS domain-containing hybrid sensor histidine kinase/response regulator [Alteromonas sp. V450]OJF69390.1 hybrid sensor histidine kinase/response regulator [Alteromonas sp. V450]